MAEFLHPVVFVEETRSRARDIEAADTGVAGFVGTLPDGPAVSERMLAMADFGRAYGDAPGVLAAAARAFFDNGGRQLYVAAAASPDAAGVAATLDALPPVDVVAAPGLAGKGVAAALMAHAGHPDHHRFALIDPPPGLDLAGIQAFRSGLNTSHAALYWPWIVTADGIVPPSPAIAGTYARVDTQRGVWKAPANETVYGATGFERAVVKSDQEILSPLGINVLRSFAGRGNRVWGGRTLASDPEWKYISIRRQIDWLDRSIAAGLSWTVFEPNGEPLWAAVRQVVGNLLLAHWRAGALHGARPEQAIFVRCDRTTMTQGDLDNGRLIVEIGIAPVRPAEFIVMRVGLWTSDRMS